MASSRKFGAVFRLALVSATFWGTAVLLGRVGYSLVQGHPFAAWFSLPWLLTRFFLPGAIIGFVGGAIYAGFLALTPSSDAARALSGKRTATFGAVGGVVVFLMLRMTLLTDGAGGLVATVVVPTLVFGALGAATGLAITGTAKRAKLPAGDAPPKRVAP